MVTFALDTAAAGDTLAAAAGTARVITAGDDLGEVVGACLMTTPLVLVPWFPGSGCC